MAASILRRFDPGTDIRLTGGSAGVFDVAVDDNVVYSKTKSLKVGDVSEGEVIVAILDHQEPKTTEGD